MNKALSTVLASALVLAISAGGASADWIDNFDQPTTFDPRWGQDEPNTGAGEVTLDTAADQADFQAYGNTDMWGSRNNAPILWVRSSTGNSYIETHVTSPTGQNGSVAGITVYADTDGANPNFSLGLDHWDNNNRMVKLQGLGTNNPNTSVSATGGEAWLRLELDRDGGAGGVDRYTAKYKLNEPDAWSTLATLDRDVANDRMGLFLKTSGGGREAQFSYAAGSDPGPAPPPPPPAPGTILGTGTGALRHDGVTHFDMTDPENDGQADADVNYNAAFTSTDEPGFGGGEYSFNVFDNRVGGGNDKWCCNDPGGAGHQLTAQFAEPITLTSFTITSSNDSPGRDPSVWAIQGSNDGTNFTDIYAFDSATDTPFWNNRNQVVLFEAGTAAEVTAHDKDYVTPATAYKYIRYDVTDTFSGGHALGELEYFDSSRTTMPPPPTPVARLTGPVGLDMAGGAYGESAGAAYAPTSWTLEEAGTPTLSQGLLGEYYTRSGDNFGVKQGQRIDLTGGGNFQFGDNFAYGPWGNLENDFKVRWTGFVDIPTAGLYSFYLDSDDRSSIFIDTDGDGIPEPCPNDGNFKWDLRWWDLNLPAGLVAIELHALEYGGGENSEFFWDLDGTANGDNWAFVPASAFSVLQTPWATLATGTNQVGDLVTDGLFGVTLPDGSHHLRLTVEASGQTTTAEGDFTFARTGEIPEPATMALLGLAVAGLGGYIRKRRRS